MLNALFLAAFLAITSSQSSDLPVSPAEVPTPPLGEHSPPKPIRDEIEGAPFLVLEDRMLPLVSGLLIFKAGSLRDPARLTGLADFFARALRQGGTGAFTGDALNQWLDAHAVELSIESNENQLRIHFRCLREDLEGLVDRIGQLLVAPAFSDQAIDLVRMQMLTEIKRAKNDGGQLADDAIDRLLLGEQSPFGRKPTKESIAKITRKSLLDFASSNLGIDRLYLGLSGDFDTATARALFAKSLGKLPKLGPAPSHPVASFNSVGKTTIFVVDRPGASQTELRIASAGLRIDDPEQVALTLWSYVVGRGGMTNRLVAEVRTKLGLADDIGCEFSARLSRPGQFSAFCTTRNDAVDETLSAMLEIISQSSYEAIPGPELEAARNRLIADSIVQYDSPSKILERALSLEFAGFPGSFFEQSLKQYEQASAREILNATIARIPLGRFLCVAVGPADEIVPKLSTVANVVMLEQRETSKDAASAVESMLAALGGREAWAQLSTIHIKQSATTKYIRGTTRVPIEQWRRFQPLSIRFKQRTTAGATFTNVVTPSEGWLIGPTGSSRLANGKLAVWKDELQHWLYYNLHRLALQPSSLKVSLSEEGRLNLFNSIGSVAWIELGEDHRPVAMGTRLNHDERLFRYSDWTEVDGLFFSMTFTDGEQAVEVELVEPNINLDDELFNL